MDEELCGFSIAREGFAHVHDDGFADAVDAVDAAAGEGLDDLIGWGFEGLRLVAGPDGADGLAGGGLVGSVGYGLYFGKFRHDFLQYRWIWVGGFSGRRIGRWGAGWSSRRSRRG